VIALILQRAFPFNTYQQQAPLIYRISQALHSDNISLALHHVLETSEDFRRIQRLAELDLPFDLCYGNIQYILTVMAITNVCSSWPPAPLAKLQDVMLDALCIPDDSTLPGGSRGLFLSPMRVQSLGRNILLSSTLESWSVEAPFVCPTFPMPTYSSPNGLIILNRAVTLSISLAIEINISHDSTFSIKISGKTNSTSPPSTHND
jgi:hypothetical protein